MEQIAGPGKFFLGGKTVIQTQPRALTSASRVTIKQWPVPREIPRAGWGITSFSLLKTFPRAHQGMDQSAGKTTPSERCFYQISHSFMVSKQHKWGNLHWPIWLPLPILFFTVQSGRKSKIFQLKPPIFNFHQPKSQQCHLPSSSPQCPLGISIYLWADNMEFSSLKKKC